MGFLSGSLGGGVSSSKTVTDTSGSSTENTTASKMDAASKAVLDALTQKLGGIVQAGPDQSFSKDAAIKDTTDLVKNIFTQFSSDTLPTIFSAAAGSGMYNSTAAANLANDAFAKTTAQAAGVVSDNIIKYAGLQQNQQQLDVNALLQSLGLQAEATQATSSNSSFSTTGTSNTGTKSLTGGLKFG